VQVWGNALREQNKAVESYHRALALGGTAPIPDLYSTAGAIFTFDATVLRTAVDLMERTITELEAS
ncbi:MAG: M3 family oligoendopeptidase, partial [Candidatus Latescibacteria bacterium]|nr:M3 family oligoendopeptidase [Candidatus Latescibacterota bacterium]